MIEIPIGVSVVCTDGQGGRTTHVIIDPVARKVTHIVVQEKKLPKGKQRLVPIDRVRETARNEIRLDCTRKELEEMEPFIGTRYIQQEPKQYPSSFYAGEGPQYLHAYCLAPDPVPVEIERVPPGELGVHRGTRVEATDGQVGWVDEFLLDPVSRQITHLIMREKHLWGKKANWPGP